MDKNKSTLMNREQLNERLKKEIEEVGNAAAFARLHGISEAYISKVLKGVLQPGKKILVALELQEITLYQPLEFAPACECADDSCCSNEGVDNGTSVR